MENKSARAIADLPTPEVELTAEDAEAARGGATGGDEVLSADPGTGDVVVVRDRNTGKIVKR